MEIHTKCRECGAFIDQDDRPVGELEAEELRDRLAEASAALKGLLEVCEGIEDEARDLEHAVWMKYRLDRAEAMIEAIDGKAWAEKPERAMRFGLAVPSPDPPSPASGSGPA